MHLALAFTMPYHSGRLLVTEYGEVCLYNAGPVVECLHRGVKRLLSATDIHSMQQGSMPRSVVLQRGCLLMSKVRLLVWG